MAKKRKNLMAYTLVVCMLVGLLPTTAFAEQDNTFICEQELHTHDESCYEGEGEQKVLTCEKEEHTHTEECLAEAVKAPQDSEEDTNSSETKEKDTEKTEDNELENTEDKEGEKQPEDTQDKADDGEQQPEDTEDKTDDKTEDNGQQTGDSQNKTDNDEKQADNTENKTDEDEKQAEQAPAEEPAASPINKVTPKKAAAKEAEPAPIAATHTEHNGVAAADWKELTSGTTEIKAGEHYFLKDNEVTVTKLNITGAGAILCLNGKTLKGSANDSSGGVIEVSNNATFTLCDCGSSGKITGATNGSGVWVGSGSTFTMQGGTITGNTTLSGYGGGVHIESGGTFTMNGGEISGNKASSGDGGGGVFVNASGTFTMTGGTITNNEANNGGGVSVASDGTFTMSGSSEISGNKAVTYGGGVYLNGGTFTLSGGSILDNKVNDKDNNVYLPNGKKITIGGTLSGKEQVGVKALNNIGGTTIATGAQAGDENYFISDDAGLKPVFDNNKVVLAEQVTVIFDANGGNFGTAQETTKEVKVLKGETVTAPTTEPTRTGYTFAGWYENADGTGEVFDFTTGISGDNKGEFKLYAKWTEQTVAPDKVTVTFDLNYTDATNAPAAQTINKGGKATKPTDPTRAGYTFIGWYENADGTGTAFNFATTAITGNLTLYAKWSETVTLTFDANGGSFGGETTKVIEFIKGGFTLPSNNPSRSNYTFDGWYLDKDCTQKLGNLTRFYQDTTLYAKWKPASTPTPSAKYSISGTVRQGSSNGKGEPYVTVTITSAFLQKTTKTDSQGRYTFTSLPKGEYIVSVEADLYAPISGEVFGKVRGSTVVTVLDKDETADIVLEQVGIEHSVPNVEVKLPDPGTITSAPVNFNSNKITINVPRPENVVGSGVPVSKITIIPTPKPNKKVLESILNGSEADIIELSAEQTNTETDETTKLVELGGSVIMNIPQVSTSGSVKINIEGFRLTENPPGSGKFSVEKLQQVDPPAAEPEPEPVPASADSPVLSAYYSEPLEDTYWIDDYGIHICFKKMGYYVIAEKAEVDEPEKPDKEPEKESAKKSGGGSRGRTGTWVKAEAEPEQKPEEIQQNEQIQNNQNSQNVQPRNDANCLKDSSCPLSQFADVNLNEWYHDGLHYCVENGLMAGTSKDLFEPNKKATRAMVVTILWRLENSPVVNTEMNFADVVDGSYYQDAVAWAVSNGIVSGYDEKTFAPEGDITREQMAAILYRYSQYKGKDVTAGNELNFADANEVSSYAVKAVQWACATGIINGTSSTQLSPQGNATRAQLAQMLKVYRNM